MIQPVKAGVTGSVTGALVVVVVVVVGAATAKVISRVWDTPPAKFK